MVLLLTTCSIATLALGIEATAVVAVLLAVALLATLLAGGRLVERAIKVTRARADQQALAAEARFGAGVARAHDWIRVGGDLRALLSRGSLDSRLREAIGKALATTEGLGEAMRSTQAARTRRDGSGPPLGGHAPEVLERIGGSLKPFSWTPRRLVPVPLRGAGTQFSLVMDEVRVLHNADIERAVLLFTLVSRAALVTLAPLLGAWTRAATPVAETGTVADFVWASAAIVSLATAAIAPRVADTAMRDTDQASQFRRRLLAIEVPIALSALILLPAWTVVVFTAGWTNWWQRQTPRLEFDWAKLAIFAVAVVVLQATGLTIQSIPPADVVLEIAISLLALSMVGGSYGAMLPLAFATILSVVVGDGSRSIRTARRARGNLLDCARQLRSTASLIDAEGPAIPLALSAATMSRQAASKLEREADLFGRRGLLAPRVVAEIFDQAIGGCNLLRPDSAQLDLQRIAAAERDEPEPAFALEPILGRLANLTVAKQRHAHVLRSLLIAAYNEAGVHGTKGVRASLTAHEEQLMLRIGNLPRPRSAGTAGEGGQRLAALVTKLPGGALAVPPGPRPAGQAGYPGSAEWWVLEVLIDASILSAKLK